MIETKSVAQAPKFISMEFRDKYLDPRGKEGNKIYQKWEPTSQFTIITDKFGEITADLFADEIKSGSLKPKNRLIQSSSAFKPSKNQPELNPVDVSNYAHWKDSIELFTDMFGREVELELTPRLLIPENKSEYKCGIFGENLALGSNGWDIIYNDGDTLEFVMNEETQKSHLKAECLEMACRRFIRTRFKENKSTLERDFFRKLVLKSFESRIEKPTVFDNNQSFWIEKYLPVSFDAYLERCTPSQIDSLFTDVYEAVKVIWDTDGHPPPSDVNATNFHVKMSLRDQYSHSSDALLDDLQIDKEVNNWYRNIYSAASDEPKIHFPGYQSKPNYRDVMSKGSKNQQDKLQKKGLFNFIGCRLPLGMIFSNIANQSEGITLNQKDGRTLEQHVQKIATGDLEVRNNIVMIEDGLLIKGQSCSSLTIHVFHLVTMAAMEKLLLEND